MTINCHKTSSIGLLFIAVGLFFFITGWSLDYGTPADMGAGFLPLTISAMLIAIGFLELMRGIFIIDKTVEFALWRPMVLAISIVVFGFLLETVGAILLVLMLMLPTAFLHKKFTLKSFGISYLVAAGLLLSFKLLLGSTISL